MVWLAFNYQLSKMAYIFPDSQQAHIYTTGKLVFIFQKFLCQLNVDFESSLSVVCRVSRHNMYRPRCHSHSNASMVPKKTNGLIKCIFYIKWVHFYCSDIYHFSSLSASIYLHNFAFELQNYIQNVKTNSCLSDA